MKYKTVSVGELFSAESGKPRYIRDYIDRHPGSFPVYSASVLTPFGHVSTYDYSGHYLTWVMNGYGGRVQEVRGEFSATRDRGVFVPRPDVIIPDLTYLRFAMEPQLVGAAVGRRVDDRKNDYVKLYPEEAEQVSIILPATDEDQLDFAYMAVRGEKLRRIEQAQESVRSVYDRLKRTMFTVEVPKPSVSVTLGDDTCFVSSIGERVLRSELSTEGVPIYSANVLKAFGAVKESNLHDFSKPSLLWGIDGIFDWNMISAGKSFATTDHCGRLQIISDNIDPDYVFCYLKMTKQRYGFDRVFRASLSNIRAEVSVELPLDDKGRPSLEKQQQFIQTYRQREIAEATLIKSLKDVLQARITAQL